MQVSVQQRLLVFLVYILGVPLIKLLEMTGLYIHLARMMRKQFKQRTAHSFGAYQPDAHDVLVCSYPKSGTNWMMQIAYQTAFRGQGEFEHVHKVIPWPDSVYPLQAQLDDENLAKAAPTNLRVIKTHLDWQHIPYSPEAHYILVLRDPKDAFVSSYHFVRDVGFGVMMPSINTWLQTFLMADTFFMGSWAENVDSYWQVRERDNVLLVTFEQMKADQRAIIQQVTDLMGVELTPEEFNLVDEKSHFRYMKTISEKFDPPKTTPWIDGDAQLIRSGKSGASSELLTVEQQRQIDDFCRAELQRLGSDFPYDEMFELA